MFTSYLCTRDGADTCTAAGGDGVLYPIQFEPGLVDLEQLHAENQLKKAGDNAQLNHMNTVHLNAMAENLLQLQTGLQALLPAGAVTDKELQAHEVKLHEHQVQIQQMQMQQLTPQQQRLLQQQLDQIQQQQLAVHQYQQQHEAKRLQAQQKQRMEEQEKEMEKRTETGIALPVPATPVQQQKALRDLKEYVPLYACTVFYYSSTYSSHLPYPPSSSKQPSAPLVRRLTMVAAIGML